MQIFCGEVTEDERRKLMNQPFSITKVKNKDLWDQFDD